MNWKSCLLAAIALAVGLLGGCASTSSARDEADYVFVYLKTGPQNASLIKSERQKVFQGHMANIHRLADAGQLIIAGPFEKPNDPAWRGIFVLDVPTVAEGERLVATDPGVEAGVFAPELRRMRASAALRQTLQLEKDMNAAIDAHPKDTEPPRRMRGYVMVTAADANVTLAGLRKAQLLDKIIWSGRFSDPDPGRKARGGVFVLDSTSAPDVKSSLEAAHAGECWVDGWLSTASLEKLPPEAAGR